MTVPPEPKNNLATFTMNGEPREVPFPLHKTLLEVLREKLNLTGPSTAASLANAAPAQCRWTARRSSAA